jgi:predicted permease
MSDAFVALFFAAGSAAVAYTQLGRRAGYSNSSNVWTIVAITFVIVFIIAFTVISTLLHIH